jgi:hypothetical protein
MIECGSKHTGFSGEIFFQKWRSGEDGYAKGTFKDAAPEGSLRVPVLAAYGRK